MLIVGLHYLVAFHSWLEFKRLDIKNLFKIEYNNDIAYPFQGLVCSQHFICPLPQLFGQLLVFGCLVEHGVALNSHWHVKCSIHELVSLRGSRDPELAPTTLMRF